MEIVDFLRMRRRRLWILAAVPLISGLVVAMSVMLGQSGGFTAGAIVAAPALVGGSNQYTGTQGVTQYVSAFEGAATSAVVLSKVAAENHVSVPRLNANVTVTQVGSSPILRVSYVGQKRATVDDIARGVATETLRYLFGSQVTLAQETVDRAQQDVDALAAQMSTVGQSVGAVDPQQLYQSIQQQMLNLQSQQVQQRANGNSSGAAAIESQISTLKNNLATLTPTVEKYAGLAQRHDTALTVLSSANQALSQARAQLAAADPTKVITVTSTHSSDTPQLIQKVAPAIGAGLFLAVLLFATIELLARREREDRSPTLVWTGRRWMRMQADDVLSQAPSTVGDRSIGD